MLRFVIKPRTDEILIVRPTDCWLIHMNKCCLSIKRKRYLFHLLWLFKSSHCYCLWGVFSYFLHCRTSLKHELLILVSFLIFFLDKTTLTKCLLICTITLCLTVLSLATQSPDRNSPEETKHERSVSKVHGMKYLKSIVEVSLFVHEMKGLKVWLIKKK